MNTKSQINGLLCSSLLALAACGGGGVTSTSSAGSPTAIPAVSSVPGTAAASAGQGLSVVPAATALVGSPAASAVLAAPAASSVVIVVISTNTPPVQVVSIPPAPVDPVKKPVQTTIPTPNYPAASLELKVFNTLNHERASCGVGLQSQSPILDLAAAKHAEYMKLRWEEGGNPAHTEESSKSGFFGVSPNDRAVTAGYLGQAGGENVSFEYAYPAYDLGDRLARNLLDTIYHLALVFGTQLDVGVGISLANQPGLPPLATMVWDQGSPRPAAGYAWGQYPSASVLTYPCDGTTGVKTTFTGETPDPFAGVAMGSYTTLGHPIYVFSPSEALMSVTSAEIMSAAGSAIPNFIYTSVTDPQKKVKPSQVFIVPLVALQVSTKYTVQIRGSAGSVPFAKAFQFTTGNY